jgi:hypothetical protein
LERWKDATKFVAETQPVVAAFEEAAPMSAASPAALAEQTELPDEIAAQPEPLAVPPDVAEPPGAAQEEPSSVFLASVEDAEEFEPLSSEPSFAVVQPAPPANPAAQPAELQPNAPQSPAKSPSEPTSDPYSFEEESPSSLGPSPFPSPVRPAAAGPPAGETVAPSETSKQLLAGMSAVKALDESSENYGDFSFEDESQVSSSLLHLDQSGSK